MLFSSLERRGLNLLSRRRINYEPASKDVDAASRGRVFCFLEPRGEVLDALYHRRVVFFLEPRGEVLDAISRRKALCFLKPRSVVSFGEVKPLINISEECTSWILFGEVPSHTSSNIGPKIYIFAVPSHTCSNIGEEIPLSFVSLAF